MVNTGFSHISNKKIYDCIYDLFLKSENFLKKKDDLLNIESDTYVKNVFGYSFLLAERFIEFFKDNEWKLKTKRIDMYVIAELQNIASEANSLQRQYGKEKTAYYLSTFPKWENTYNISRDFCIDLTTLFPLSLELEHRYFINGEIISKFDKPKNPIVRALYYMLDKLINRLLRL